MTAALRAGLGCGGCAGAGTAVEPSQSLKRMFCRSCCPTNGTGSDFVFAARGTTRYELRLGRYPSPNAGSYRNARKGLAEGREEFQVPIWQRQYTWRATQHAQLWSDLVEQYRHLKSGNPASSGHFLGSFVLSPKDPAAAGVSYFLVIDGQQRLTTLMLLLCALRDRAAETDPSEWSATTRSTRQRVPQGEARMRLLPTKEDRTSFRRWLTREPDNGAGDDISRAYRFYSSRLSESAGRRAGRYRIAEPRCCRTVEIVEIGTQAGDNAHRIFQS